MICKSSHFCFGDGGVRDFIDFGVWERMEEHEVQLCGLIHISGTSTYPPTRWIGKKCIQ